MPADGCFEAAGGCLELPFMCAEVYERGGAGGCLAILAVVGLIGLGVNKLSPEPERPCKSSITLQERTIGHPINRMKIERAERKWREEQRRKAEEKQQAEADPAPVKSASRWARVKRWAHSKLDRGDDE